MHFYHGANYSLFDCSSASHLVRDKMGVPSVMWGMMCARRMVATVGGQI
jgi:hypothetical protein